MFVVTCEASSRSLSVDLVCANCAHSAGGTKWSTRQLMVNSWQKL